MSTVIALFENPRDAKGAIEGLTLEGYGKDEIGVLSKENITEEDSQEIYNKRTGDLGGIIGMMVGGHAGLLATTAVFTLPGIGIGAAVGTLAMALSLSAGGAAGAAAGAVLGHRWMPELMERYGITEEEAHHFADAVKRDGVLLTVDVDPEDQEHIATMLRDEMNAIDIRSSKTPAANSE